MAFLSYCRLLVNNLKFYYSCVDIWSLHRKTWRCGHIYNKKAISIRIHAIWNFPTQISQQIVCQGNLPHWPTLGLTYTTDNRQFLLLWPYIFTLRLGESIYRFSHFLLIKYIMCSLIAETNNWNGTFFSKSKTHHKQMILMSHFFFFSTNSVVWITNQWLWGSSL